MKKQLIMISAAAMLSLSAFSNAATDISTAVKPIDANADRAISITGAPANYITDTFNFKLSANVIVSMLQDANAAAMNATTFKGTNAVFGGSTQDGVGVYGCTALANAVAADGTVTVVTDLAEPCVSL